MLLATYLDMDPGGVQIAEDAGEKPRLRPQGAQMLQFSLSHSAGLAAIAIASQREVGVDVEQIRQDIDVEAIARHLLLLGSSSCWQPCPISTAAGRSSRGGR